MTGWLALMMMVAPGQTPPGWLRIPAPAAAPATAGYTIALPPQLKRVAGKTVAYRGAGLTLAFDAGRAGAGCVEPCRPLPIDGGVARAGHPPATGGGRIGYTVPVAEGSHIVIGTIMADCATPHDCALADEIVGTISVTATKR